MGLEEQYDQWNEEYRTLSYSQKDIDEMFKGFYEDIMQEIAEKYDKKTSSKQKYYFRIKAPRKRVENLIVAQLHKFLIEAECIDKETLYNEFYGLFSGNAAEEPYSFLGWLKTDGLAVYLFDCMKSERWLDDFEVDNKIMLFLGIKNVAQKRTNYFSYNKLQKPKDGETIDKIILQIKNRLE